MIRLKVSDLIFCHVSTLVAVSTTAISSSRIAVATSNAKPWDFRCPSSSSATSTLYGIRDYRSFFRDDCLDCNISEFSMEKQPLAEIHLNRFLMKRYGIG